MLKKIVASALISAVVIGLSGCVGAGKPEVKKLSSFKKNEIKTVSFLIAEVDPLTDEKISYNVSNYNFSDILYSNSKYQKFHSTSNYKTIQPYEGLKVKRKHNTYELQYSNGERNNRWYLNETIFYIHYSKLAGNKIKFTLDSNYKYQPFSNAIGISIDPLDTASKLELDAKRIFSKLKLEPIPITISKTYHLKNELNSKYPAESIYANFKRMLGNYTYRNNEKISESKKENTFNLKVNEQSVPLYVEVFPYREGSKVKYTTTLPYKITHSGSNLTKKDIENINAKIAKIVND